MGVLIVNRIDSKTDSKSKNFKNVGLGLLLTVATGMLLLGGCSKAKQPENNSGASPEVTQGAPPPPNAPSGAPASDQGAPPPPTPPPAPVVYRVRAGSRISVRISQTLDSQNSSVGDTFGGRLAYSVRVQGVPVLEAGTPVTGTVVDSKGQGRFRGTGILGITLTRIGSQPVTTSDYVRSVASKGKRSAGFIGGGAGGGALIGALAGGGKGALIGGLLGGGAGTAGAAFTGNKEVAIRAESVVSFTLRNGITVTRPPGQQ